MGPDMMIQFPPSFDSNYGFSQNVEELSIKSSHNSLISQTFRYFFKDNKPIKVKEFKQGTL